MTKNENTERTGAMTEEHESNYQEPVSTTNQKSEERRVHIPETEVTLGDDGVRRASNGGLFEILISGDEKQSFEIVRSKVQLASADDLRSLRNLVLDIEGDVFPVSPPSRARLPFWKWKADVILRILEHPAMCPDADPEIYPDFDALAWEEDFLTGMTVEEEYQKADALFHQCGW